MFGTRLVAVTIAAVVCVPACDFIYGVNRVGQIPALPDLNCVEGAIVSVPQVDSVRRWEERGGRPLTLTGIKAPERLYYFAYETGETGAVLYFNVDYKGRVRFSQHRIAINQKVPQSEIDAVRPVMIEIERALEERCAIPELRASIEEHCSGVDCEGN